jgi:nucleoside-diphosphate-sugar epimerase
MNTYLIVGAGPVGTGVAEQLLARGEQVTVVTRSGRGPDGARNIALDAADTQSLTSLAQGATAIFNCANPAYHRWATDWPPLAAAMLAAAEATEAVLVIASNLYGYGPVDRPMTPDLPLAGTTIKGKVRASMWLDALAAHEAGRVRAVEVRGADYVVAGDQSQLDRQLPALLAGKKCRVLGNPDVPHSWTYTGDMVRTLVAVADAPEAWGRPWHALVASDDSQRQALTQLAAMAGLPTPTIAPVPMWQLKMIGLFNKTVAQLPELAYQLEGPFVCDDSATREILDLAPTPWPEVLQRSLSAAGR